MHRSAQYLHRMAWYSNGRAWLFPFAHQSWRLKHWPWKLEFVFLDGFGRHLFVFEPNELVVCHDSRIDQSSSNILVYIREVKCAKRKKKMRIPGFSHLALSLFAGDPMIWKPLIALFSIVEALGLCTFGVVRKPSVDPLMTSKASHAPHWATLPTKNLRIPSLRACPTAPDLWHRSR